MELVEGQPLSARLEFGPLAADEAVRIGIQLADAVGHAHDRNIIHRDLKCANVVISTEGRVKVLDFGLAKPLLAEAIEGSTEQLLTRPGVLAGTIAYMAPEQLRGLPAGTRSDVWSLGVVLYELLAGRRPFSASTTYELSAAILTGAVPPLPLSVPPAVSAVVARCLQKNPADRYSRGGELRAALEAIQSGAAPAVKSATTPHRFSIAVLPLRNITGDAEQAHLVEGTHEALIADLAKVAALRVVARPSVMRYRDVEKPLSQIAAEIGVEALLTGSVFRSGNRVRITAQLIDGKTEEHLWSDRYDRDLSDVIMVQSEIVAAIAREIRLHVTPEERKELERRRVVDPETYELLLRGRLHAYRFTPPELDLALKYFEKARERDPLCAAAYVGIAQVWAHRAVAAIVPHRQAGPPAKVAALEALRLDDTLADAHELLAIMFTWYDFDWVQGEAEFRRAIELNPNHADSRLFYGHFLTAMKRWGEARAEMERAMELDPLNAFFQGLYGWHLAWLERWDDALRWFETSIQTSPGFMVARMGLWAAHHAKGMLEVALRHLLAILEMMGDFEAAKVLVRGNEEGGYQRAVLLLARLMAQRPIAKPFLVAVLFDHAGATDDALHWLDRSYELRDHDLGYLAVQPLSTALRANPRFTALLDQLELPH